MRSPLQLVFVAAALHLSSAPAHAQVHSPQVQLHRKEHTEDLSWLLQYTKPSSDGDENSLVHDARFRPMLARHFTAPQSFWSEGKPLADAVYDFLSGPPGSALNEENRYVVLDACVAHFCPDRGLLWIDLGLPKPLLVFAAIDWISDGRSTDERAAAYTMWIFSNRALALDRIPPAFKRSIERWTAQPSSGSNDLQNITRVFVIDPDGTPHPIDPASIGAHSTLPAETNTDIKTLQP